MDVEDTYASREAPEIGDIVVVNKNGADGGAMPLSTTITIGRDENCDIRIRLKEVSRHQVELIADNGRAWITNMSGSNPTNLNGETMAVDMPVLLQHNDKFFITGREFRFVYRPEYQHVVAVEAPPAGAGTKLQKKSADQTVQLSPRRLNKILADKTKSAQTLPESVSAVLATKPASVLLAPAQATENVVIVASAAVVDTPAVPINDENTIGASPLKKEAEPVAVSALPTPVRNSVLKLRGGQTAPASPVVVKSSPQAIKMTEKSPSESPTVANTMFNATVGSAIKPPKFPKSAQKSVATPKAARIGESPSAQSPEHVVKRLAVLPTPVARAIKSRRVSFGADKVHSIPHRLDIVREMQAAAEEEAAADKAKKLATPLRKQIQALKKPTPVKSPSAASSASKAVEVAQMLLQPSSPAVATAPNSSANLVQDAAVAMGMSSRKGLPTPVRQQIRNKAVMAELKTSKPAVAVPTPSKQQETAPIAAAPEPTETLVDTPARQKQQNTQVFDQIRERRVATPAAAAPESVETPAAVVVQQVEEPAVAEAESVIKRTHMYFDEEEGDATNVEVILIRAAEKKLASVTKQRRLSSANALPTPLAADIKKRRMSKTPEQPQQAHIEEVAEECDDGYGAECEEGEECDEEPEVEANLPEDEDIATGVICGKHLFFLSPEGVPIAQKSPASAANPVWDFVYDVDAGAETEVEEERSADVRAAFEDEAAKPKAGIPTPVRQEVKKKALMRDIAARRKSYNTAASKSTSETATTAPLEPVLEDVPMTNSIEEAEKPEEDGAVAAVVDEVQQEEVVEDAAVEAVKHGLPTPVKQQLRAKAVQKEIVKRRKSTNVAPIPEAAATTEAAVEVDSTPATNVAVEETSTAAVDAVEPVAFEAPVHASPIAAAPEQPVAASPEPTGVWEDENDPRYHRGAMSILYAASEGRLSTVYEGEDDEERDMSTMIKEDELNTSVVAANTKANRRRQTVTPTKKRASILAETVASAKKDAEVTSGTKRGRKSIAKPEESVVDNDAVVSASDADAPATSKKRARKSSVAPTPVAATVEVSEQVAAGVVPESASVEVESQASSSRKRARKSSVVPTTVSEPEAVVVPTVEEVETAPAVSEVIVSEPVAEPAAGKKRGRKSVAVEAVESAPVTAQPAKRGRKSVAVDADAVEPAPAASKRARKAEAALPAIVEEEAPEPVVEAVAAPEQPTSLTEADVRGMKVADLKEALQSRGLDANGLKAALIERLLATITSSSTPVEVDAAPVPVKGRAGKKGAAAVVVQAEEVVVPVEATTAVAAPKGRGKSRSAAKKVEVAEPVAAEPQPEEEEKVESKPTRRGKAAKAGVEAETVDVPATTRNTRTKKAAAAEEAPAPAATRATRSRK